LAIPILTLAQGGPYPRTARKGFVQDIEKLTEQNEDFRRVLYTAKNLQLVVMSLPPGEHIGLETHDVDQFFRIEQGKGDVLIDGKRSPIGTGSAVVVPAGSQHDFFNTGTSALKLYTVYAPPNHRDRVVHHTKTDAERDHERFDGKTSE
jgi:mannose-6-phosphate isomerase-like protein (cupin superfamily)